MNWWISLTTVQKRRHHQHFVSNGVRYLLLLPHTQIMIHQPSGGMDGQTTDLLIAAHHIEEIRNDLNHILAGNCGRTLPEIQSLTERDHWMSAIEAVEFGIADRIITKGEN